jgi:hypothetical protein
LALAAFVLSQRGLLAVVYWLLAIAYWLLAIGYCLLAIGSCLLAIYLIAQQ